MRWRCCTAPHSTTTLSTRSRTGEATYSGLAGPDFHRQGKRESCYRGPKESYPKIPPWSQGSHTLYVNNTCLTWYLDSSIVTSLTSRSLRAHQCCEFFFCLTSFPSASRATRHNSQTNHDTWASTLPFNMKDESYTEPRGIPGSINSDGSLMLRATPNVECTPIYKALNGERGKRRSRLGQFVTETFGVTGFKQSLELSPVAKADRVEQNCLYNIGVSCNPLLVIFIYSRRPCSHWVRTSGGFEKIGFIKIALASTLAAAKSILRWNFKLTRTERQPNSLLILYGANFITAYRLRQPFVRMRGTRKITSGSISLSTLSGKFDSSSASVKRAKS